MSLEERLRRALSVRRDEAAGPGCPDPALLARFVSGERSREVTRHLSACASCREDVLVARSLVRRAPPARAPRLAWFAVAAAILFAVAIGSALLVGGPGAPGLVRAPTPAPKIEPRPEAPRVALPPVPTAPRPRSPDPAPPGPVTPSPAPNPPTQEKRALPPEPAPTVVAKPPAPPEPPGPAPKPVEKPPAPEPTRAKPRATLLALSGGGAAQVEGETAWQNVKLSQPREFSGSIRLRAEATPSKARIGGATYYLRGGTEVAVAIDEGTTTVRLSKGEAFFDVTPGRDAFVVETSSGTVSVQGTRFLVVPGEVVVQRGQVEFRAGDRTTRVAAGERSQEAKAPEKADVAKRLQWLRPLEETLVVKPEAMTLQQGMLLIPDPAAPGGRAIAQKGPPAPGSEPSAEARMRRKQSCPYAVWIRIHWGHNVPPGFSIQVHDLPRWSGKDVPFNPAWQWVKVGVFGLPDEPFRIRVIDPQGGLRLDQILLTSDLELVPDPK